LVSNFQELNIFKHFRKALGQKFQTEKVEFLATDVAAILELQPFWNFLCGRPRETFRFINSC
jgi:hypothetical protein